MPIGALEARRMHISQVYVTFLIFLAIVYSRASYRQVSIASLITYLVCACMPPLLLYTRYQ